MAVDTSLGSLTFSKKNSLTVNWVDVNSLSVTVTTSFGPVEIYFKMKKPHWGWGVWHHPTCENLWEKVSEVIGFQGTVFISENAKVKKTVVASCHLWQPLLHERKCFWGETDSILMTFMSTGSVWSYIHRCPRYIPAFAFKLVWLGLL